MASGATTASGATAADGGALAQAVLGEQPAHVAERPERARKRSDGTSRRRGISGAVWSGLAGFVLGAIFWHLVGFWSFVSHVVFKGPTGDTTSGVEAGALPATRRDGLKQRETAKASEQAKLKDPVSGEARPLDATAAGGGSTCASLERTGRVTRASACGDRVLPTLTNRGGNAAPREDLASARSADASETAGSWSATTWTVQVDAAEAAAVKH